MSFNLLVKYQVIMLALQVILYFGCEFFQKNPNYIDIELDKKIPVIPLFVLVYVLWFPVISIFPLSLYGASPILYKPYMSTWIIVLAISIIIYMIYPTTFERPKNLDDYAFGFLLKFIYKSSYRGLNCMPSLHCSMSTMVIVFALASAMVLRLKLIYVAVSIGIIISTLFTKQHVILDVVTGVGLGLVCSFLFLLSL